MKLTWKGALLWSNHFYGICAVLLAIETNLILNHKMPDIFLLLFIHLATVVYYTHAYLHESHDGVYNDRTTWYQSNAKYILLRQIFFSCLCIWIGLIKLDFFNLFFRSTLWIKCMLLLSIFISAIYYLPKYAFFSFIIFRHNGILKSVSIALVWSMFCCFFPAWFSLGNQFTQLFSTYIFWNHFIFLFLFILVLAILFDIKDLYRDKNELVRTIVSKHGIDFTIQKIIVPLIILILLFVLIGYMLHINSKRQVIINLLVLGLTYIIAKRVINHNAIHTNILMIDGIIIIKALIGIVLWILMLNS
ncbi:MAG: hypothetical protein RI940_826 [Bacteroidota bacterium]